METTELGSAEQPPVAEIAPFEVVVAFPFAAFVAVVAVDPYSFVAYPSVAFAAAVAVAPYSLAAFRSEPCLAVAELVVPFA